MPKFAIIGTTTWGITLGVVLAGKKADVGLWARTEQEAVELGNAGRHSKVVFPTHLQVTSSLPEALSGAKAVILAVPSQSMRQNIKAVAEHLDSSMLVVSAAKGLELTSNKRLSEVIADEINPDFWSNICVLSGPNLAQEILQNLPAVAVVAAQDEAVAKKAQRLLNTPSLCLYINTDVTGVGLW
jgi:glycerol-3-phosphate dehydrogenase (NAD(P)+)